MAWNAPLPVWPLGGKLGASHPGDLVGLGEGAQVGSVAGVPAQMSGGGRFSEVDALGPAPVRRPVSGCSGTVEPGQRCSPVLLDHTGEFVPLDPDEVAVALHRGPGRAHVGKLREISGFERLQPGQGDAGPVLDLDQAGVGGLTRGAQGCADVSGRRARLLASSPAAPHPPVAGCGNHVPSLRPPKSYCEVSKPGLRMSSACSAGSWIPLAGAGVDGSELGSRRPVLGCRRGRRWPPLAGANFLPPPHPADGDPPCRIGTVREQRADRRLSPGPDPTRVYATRPPGRPPGATPTGARPGHRLHHCGHQK